MFLQVEVQLLIILALYPKTVKKSIIRTFLLNVPFYPPSSFIGSFTFPSYYFLEIIFSFNKGRISHYEN